MHEIIVVAALVVPAAVGLAAVAVTESKLRRMKLVLLLGLLASAVPARAMIDEDDDWLKRFAEPERTAAVTADENKARAAAESFLRSWLVQGDIDAAVAKTDIAVDGIVGGLWQVRDQATLETWRRKWLTMWFYPDHAAVAAKGHGIVGKPGWASLAEKPSDVPGRARWITTPQFTIKPTPVGIGVHAGKTAYAVKVDMKTAPKDEVWLFLVEIRGRWKVMLLESEVRF